MTTLSIPEMSCSHCKASVEKAIKSVDPTAVLDFDMVARTVTVQSDAVMDTMRAALKTVGYETTVS